MLNRHIQPNINNLLEVMPALLIRGGRQTGKTTLVQKLCDRAPFSYFTLDDTTLLGSASRDPSGWVQSLPKPVIIDEVQRAPEIFLPIKKEIDQSQKNGQFILTGSANPFLLPKMGDSLAGRMGIIDLYPFSQDEIVQRKSFFIEHLFATSFEPKKNAPLDRSELFEKCLKGGYPRAYNLDLKNVNIWIKAYLEALIERDIRDISNIEGLKEIPSLLRLLASRSSCLLVQANLARALGISQPTVRRYITLLEALYVVHFLPGWYSNLGKRLTKAPKIHIIDTALLAYLTDTSLEKLSSSYWDLGPMLETFVFTELLKQCSWNSMDCSLFHFRDGMYEVDFLLEKNDGSIVGIEVKSSSTLTQKDLKGIQHLKSITGRKFQRGIILYCGQETLPLTKDIWAVPIQALWSK